MTNITQIKIFQANNLAELERDINDWVFTRGIEIIGTSITYNEIRAANESNSFNGSHKESNYIAVVTYKSIVK